MPKHPVTATDLYTLQVVEDPQISPDGRQIAFVKVTIDKVSNVYRRHIWLAATGATPRVRQFTFGPKSDTTPRWSPDGRTLAFVSNRNDKPQIYLIDLEGGEARPLTQHPNGASNPTWSPDGTRLAFVARVNAEERMREEAGYAEPPPATALEARHRKEQAEERERQKTDPRVITRFPYRSGTEFHDDRFDHVYVLPVNGTDAAPLRLTDGDTNFNHIAWSADGRSILSIQSREPDYDPVFHCGVVQVDATKRKAFKWLTKPGHDYLLARASTDGKWMAALRSVDEGTFGRLQHLTLFPVAGGEPRDLTLALDRNIVGLQWSADSRTLYFLAGDHGDVGVYAVRVSAANKHPALEHLVSGTRILTNFSVSRSGQIAFTAWTPERPSDLYVTEPGGQGERRLTDFNGAWLAERDIVSPEEIRYTAPDGKKVQGWLLKPPGMKRGKKYPLIVNMHGGPHIMWGPSYPDMWFEFQQQAASGYCVFYCNPRGSQGYGEAWADATHNDWGDHVMRDILAGVDYVSGLNFVDPKRLALTGGSYAGYMTAWILSRDQRFRCGWAQRGLYNFMSFYGTSDIPILIEREFDVMAFDALEKMWQHSPLAYVRTLTTPLAIEHQDNDFRCPASEAEQLYSALKRLKREVLYIRYPREGHEMSRAGEPLHRVDRLERMRAWFDKYCKK